MNISQSNLFEVLDAFQVSARVGKGMFTILDPVFVDNGHIKAALELDGIYIYENDHSMYCLLKMGELGIICKSKYAKLIRVVLLDFTHEIPKMYLDVKDYTALLTHLTEDKWLSDFVLGDIDV